MGRSSILIIDAIIDIDFDLGRDLARAWCAKRNALLLGRGNSLEMDRGEIDMAYLGLSEINC